MFKLIASLTFFLATFFSGPQCYAHFDSAKQVGYSNSGEVDLPIGDIKSVSLKIAQALPQTQRTNSSDAPRGFANLGERLDGWGGVECDPNVHPENWHNCNVLRSRMSIYRDGQKAGGKHIDRSIQKIYGNNFGWTRLLFRNGVLVMEGREGHVDQSKYDEIDLARLAGNFVRARELESVIAESNRRADLAGKDFVRERINLLRKICVGKPIINTAVLEKLSNRLRANPSQIELNRVEFSDSILGSCWGILRHPRGTTRCELEFDSRGRISDFSQCND